MMEIYDVVKLIKENVGNCGLAEGSEHFVAFACDDCEIAGIIINGGTEAEEVLLMPFKYLEVIGEASNNITRRSIDDVANKHHLRICPHV